MSHDETTPQFTGDQVKDMGSNPTLTPLENLLVNLAFFVKVVDVLIEGIQAQPEPKIFPSLGLYAREAGSSVLTQDGQAAKERVRLIAARVPIEASFSISEAFNGVRDTPLFRGLVEKMGGDEDLGAKIRVTPPAATPNGPQTKN